MNEKCENCHEMTRYRLELIGKQATQIRDLLQQVKRQESADDVIDQLKQSIKAQEKTISLLSRKCDELIAEKGEAANAAQGNNPQLIASVAMVQEIATNADHAARSLMRLSNSLQVAVMAAEARNARAERTERQKCNGSSAAGSAEPSDSERDK